MSSAKQTDKKILVSFMSDSEDEGNTSSSSALTSHDEQAQSSDDENTTKTKSLTSRNQPLGTSGGKNTMDEVIPVATSSNMEQASADNSISQKVSKSKNASNEESLPVLLKTLTEINNAIVVTEVKKEKSKKYSKGEETIENAKLESSIEKSDSQDSKVVEDKAEKSSTSKSKRNAAIDTVVVETGVDPEERNLAPPTKNKSKSRSKSPRYAADETTPENASTATEVKEPATVESFFEDQKNLAPPLEKKSSKSRSKSPKNAD